MRRIAVTLLVGTIFAGCGVIAPPGSTEVDWGETPVEHRGKDNQRFVYWCPPGGDLTSRTVWGTDVYTDDSSICIAAVHAGKINRIQGGVVEIEIRPGQSSYTGTSRNGVTTVDYGEWGGSFVFAEKE